MENAYYIQEANKLFPIFGVSSMQEAKNYVDEKDHNRIIESAERVLMNPTTGSVDFESGWGDLDGLAEVRYNAEEETWVEA